MAIYWPIPGFKGRTFTLCVLNRRNFNFWVRSCPLRGAALVEWCKDSCVNSSENHGRFHPAASGIPRHFFVRPFQTDGKFCNVSSNILSQVMWHLAFFTLLSSSHYVMFSSGGPNQLICDRKISRFHWSLNRAIGRRFENVSLSNSITNQSQLRLFLT